MHAARSAELTAKNTKRMAAAASQVPPPSNDAARIAYLEGRVAALEARVQWAIEAIQHQQKQTQLPQDPAH